MNIIPFTFENHTIRNAIDDKGEPWFVLADVCEALEIKNSRNAARRLDDDEKDTVRILDGNDPGNPNFTIISESGLYCVILRCQGATTPGTLSHRFRKWVTAEVLPTIRKAGRYEGAPATPPAPLADQADGAFQVTVPFHWYDDLLQRIIQKQETITALQNRLSGFTGRKQFEAMARVLISRTDLSDEAIATTLQDLMGDYMPEWVAWQRRRLGEARAS